MSAVVVNAAFAVIVAVTVAAAPVNVVVFVSGVQRGI